MTEREMELVIYRRLRLQRHLAVARQVWVGGGSADLAVISAAGVLTVIECKMSRVAEALRQAHSYREGADYALVVMPPREITKRMRRDFRGLGVGLAFFLADSPEPFSVKIKPRASERRRVYNRLLRRERYPTATDQRIQRELRLTAVAEKGSRKAAKDAKRE